MKVGTWEYHRRRRRRLPPDGPSRHHRGANRNASNVPGRCRCRGTDCAASRSPPECRSSDKDCPIQVNHVINRAHVQLQRSCVPLRFDHGGRGQISSKDLPDAGIANVGQLHAKGYDDAKHQGDDEAFEGSQALHGSRWIIEEQDDEHIDEGQGTTGHERDSKQQIQGDGGPNDLT